MAKVSDIPNANDFLYIDTYNLLFAEFTDAIAEDWGGKPFVDLKNGWQYVLDEYPEVTCDRRHCVKQSLTP